MKFTGEGLAIIGILAAFVVVGGFADTRLGSITGQPMAGEGGLVIDEGSSGQSMFSITTYNLLDNENWCQDSTFDICYSAELSDGRAHAESIIQSDNPIPLAYEDGVYYYEPGTRVDYECGENSQYNDGVNHAAHLWFDEGPQEGDIYFNSNNLIQFEDYARALSNEGSFEIDWDTPKTPKLSCTGYQVHWSGDKVALPKWIDWSKPWVAAQDSDNDGVYDVNDECPAQGSEGFGVKDNGCPIEDSDGDGVPDPEDECVNERGSEETDGCPDSDGDGVRDSEDEFPNDPNCVEDSDNDGVCDSKDAFPNDPDRKFDADGDGVADVNDECPTQSGTEETDGCPDSDGDGVADSNDECPNEGASDLGLKDNGCPIEDSDGDGVTDTNDKCSNTPSKASVDENGCAVDGDDDGVPDYRDECPSTGDTGAGLKDNGCPVQDDDGDGITNAVDECPDTYGSKQNGCPTFIDNILNLLLGR